MYKKKEGLYIERIDEVMVVFDSGNDRFCSFENCAQDIWNQLDQNEIDDIGKNICSVYDVDIETAKRDIEDFVQCLLEMGLIS